MPFLKIVRNAAKHQNTSAYFSPIQRLLMRKKYVLVSVPASSIRFEDVQERDVGQNDER